MKKIYTLILCVIIGVCLIMVGFTCESVETTSFSNNYFLGMKEAADCNHYMKTLNTQNLRESSLDKIEKQIFEVAEFDYDLYLSLLHVAQNNELIVEQAQNKYADIFEKSLSTALLDDTSSTLETFLLFNLDGAEQLENAMSEIKKIQQEILSIENDILEFLRDYSSQSKSHLENIFLRIANINEYDRAIFQIYMKSLQSAEANIEIYKSNILKIENFYFAISQYPIEQISPSEIENVNNHLKMMENLPKADKEGLFDIENYFMSIINKII